MEATVVDLRYKMNEVLKALDRNERVTILYHGKQKGVLLPSKGGSGKRVDEHPFFGMAKKGGPSVGGVMAKLRGGRYR